MGRFGRFEDREGEMSMIRLIRLLRIMKMKRTRLMCHPHHGMQTCPGWGGLEELKIGKVR